MGMALSLIPFGRRHGLGSGNAKLHAEARRKAEARGGKTRADERGQSSDPFQLFPPRFSETLCDFRVKLFSSDLPIDGSMQDSFPEMREEPYFCYR